MEKNIFLYKLLCVSLFTPMQPKSMLTNAQQTEILKPHNKTDADELSPAVHA